MTQKDHGIDVTKMNKWITGRIKISGTVCNRLFCCLIDRLVGAGLSPLAEEHRGGGDSQKKKKKLSNRGFGRLSSSQVSPLNGVFVLSSLAPFILPVVTLAPKGLIWRCEQCVNSKSVSSPEQVLISTSLIVLS